MISLSRFEYNLDGVSGHVTLNLYSIYIDIIMIQASQIFYLDLPDIFWIQSAIMHDYMYVK